VHATAAETFRFYSEAAALRESGAGKEEQPAGLIAWGNTGWPCCLPSTSGTIADDAAVAVSADMAAKLPKRLPARLWFVYSSDSIKFHKEGELPDARAYLSSRGCAEAPGVFFTGIGILVFHCGNGDRVP